MDDNTRDVIIALLNTIKDMKGDIVKLGALGMAAHWKDDVLRYVSEIVATLPPP